MCFKVFILEKKQLIKKNSKRKVNDCHFFPPWRERRVQRGEKLWRKKSENFLINFEQNPHLRKFVIWLEGQISRRRLSLIDGNCELLSLPTTFFSLVKRIAKVFWYKFFIFHDWNLSSKKISVIFCLAIINFHCVDDKFVDSNYHL